MSSQKMRGPDDRVHEKENWKPFYRGHDVWNTMEKLRTFIVGPILFPLRALCMFLLIFWYYLSMKIGNFSFKGTVDFSKPLEGWRRIIFVEAAQPVCRLLLFLIGFHYVKVSGPTSLTGDHGKANIITSTHSSYLDILLMMALAPEGIPSFVAKRSVQSVPLIGYQAIVWQGLFVDNRTGKVPGTNIAAQIKERAENHDMNPILIFPEGTTTNNESIITFRSGAFIGGHPVKPVVIKWGKSGFSPTWETIGGGWHVFRLLTQFSHSAEIIWLPVYYPNDAEKKDPKLFADNVRKAMAKASGLQLIDASYNDKVEYHVSIGFAKPPSPEKPKSD